MQEKNKPEEYKLFTEYTQGEKTAFIHGFESGHTYGIHDAEKIKLAIERVKFTYGKPSIFSGGDYETKRAR